MFPFVRRLSSTALPKREFTDHQHSQDGAWSSSDRPEHYDHHRRRKSARRPRPTALSLAADSVVRLGASTAGAEAGAMASSLAAAARRSARPRTQNRAWPTVRPQESDSETNNSNPPWRDVYGEGGDDADDEDYEASEGEWATEDDNGDEEARDTEAGRQRKVGPLFGLTLLIAGLRMLTVLNHIAPRKRMCILACPD